MASTKIDRRSFLIQAGRAFPVMAGAVYLLGCESPTSDDLIIDRFGFIGVSTTVAGHAHGASFRRHEIDTVNGRTWESTWWEDHTHMLTLSGADFAAILAGNFVTVTSARAKGHAHDFTFDPRET